MKTTINLPGNELAVAEYNRPHRLAQLADRLGTFMDMMTRTDLKKVRAAPWDEAYRHLQLDRCPAA